ncbi:MAG: type IX secretion system membrane protein PorP/SprF [Marinilabiliales bacterium]|nr:MAG: type IX secretion system membrane protein PorP/SprF [Marinilabiliales bacterium]
MKGLMNMKRFLLIAVIIVAASFASTAQQLPLYSQYMMNSFLLNPAVAGNDGLTSFNLTAREQWLGFENAPRTVAISGQSRLLRNSPISRGRSVRHRPTMMSRGGNVGVGGYIFNDRNGIIDRTGFQGTYAYHIWMDRHQLSFGISLTGYQLKLDDRYAILNEIDDPLLLNSRKALFVPDVNLGIYYSSPTYYAGFSTAQLLQSALKFGNDGFKDYKMLRHYYFMGGYGFFLYNGITIEPSVLVQATFESPVQVDINTRVYFRDDYWGGISYRTSGALIMMGGVKVDRFYFGYAFDYTLSSIRKHSFGSHEFMVSVKFGDTARRYRWLNRY